MKTLRSSAMWALALLAVWLILAAGDLSSLLIAVPFIVLAILLQPAADNRSDRSSPLINIGGLVQFAWFFILESLRGGVDVSRRVLAPETRVDPIFYDYAMQLQIPRAQQLFISSISLLPGTLCADLNNNQIRIHTLDQHMDTTRGIKRLESLVGKIFGEAL
jgi:multicomponent Na+:H+ antiporter subunit E